MVSGVNEQEHGTPLGSSSTPTVGANLVLTPVQQDGQARGLPLQETVLRSTFTLRQILKRYDRIGFGRRGVLDAEAEIRQAAAGLSSAERTDLHATILTWLDGDTAADWAAPLHYNLPEHIQALAIRLCALLPIGESLPHLRELHDRGVFSTEETQACQQALREALALFERKS